MKLRKLRVRSPRGTTPGRGKKRPDPTANSVSRLRRLLGSRLINVIAMMAAMFAFIAGGQLLREKTVPAQISFTEQGSPEIAPSSTGGNGIEAPPKFFAGEVYDTSIRLREAAAFGMAVSLVVIDEFARRRMAPPDVKSVQQAITRQNLLPPGFDVREQGISTPSSELIFRYRANPLAFEIVSRPNPETGGPALMIRFPIVSTSGRGVPFFRSSIARRMEVPEPFATAEQLGSTGWKLDGWQGEMLKLDSDTMNRLTEEQRELKPKDLDH